MGSPTDAGCDSLYSKQDHSRGLNMAGRSLSAASEEQRAASRSLAESRGGGEADRARSVLLTRRLTSPPIAEAFGVREDAVRCGAATCGGGVEGLKANVAPVRPR